MRKTMLNRIGKSYQLMYISVGMNAIYVPVVDVCTCGAADRSCLVSRGKL